METADLHAEVWEGIRKGFDADRLAHAYVIVGSPRGNALQFTESFLKLLFCDQADKPCNACVACRQVGEHKHADTLWLEPQSKSRQIRADDVRILVQRIMHTSFEGGWKAGIILAADCMNTNAANVLLKTLEEPPPKTILILVTDSPQSLLPTIISRCQKIVLSGSGRRLEDAEWKLPLMDLLQDLPPANGLSATRMASQFKGLFDGIRSGIASQIEEDLGHSEEALDESRLKEILAARTNARLKEIQSDVFRVMLDWHRDVLLMATGSADGHLVFPDEETRLSEQAKLHSPSSVLKAIRVVENMSQRTARNIPDLQIFDEAFRQLIR